MMHARLLRSLCGTALLMVFSAAFMPLEALAQRKVPSKELAARFIKLGMSYREGGDADNALYFLNKGLNLSRQTKSRYWEAAAYEMTGLVYKDLRDKDRAVANLQKARRIYNDIIRSPDGSQIAIEREIEQAQMMEYNLGGGGSSDDNGSSYENESALARQVEVLRNQVDLLKSENAALRDEIAMLRTANTSSLDRLNTPAPPVQSPVQTPVQSQQRMQGLNGPFNSAFNVEPVNMMDLDALENMNGFTSLEEALKNPDAVIKLDLQNNGMRTLPPEIGRFRNLQYLNVSRNQLSELPREIGNLTKLQVLNASGNQIDVIPSELRRLQSLKQLNLATNLLKKLPPEIGNLTKLEFLDASENRLAQMPAAIGLAANLRTLYLRTNSLTTLPAEIGKLKRLRDLDVDDNFFTEDEINNIFATLPDTNVISETQQGAQAGLEEPAAEEPAAEDNGGQ
jgi:tetratricopeptide (TPR) repeat protein